MPAVAYKERPQRREHQRPELRTFHARLLVTRAEEWWVEARTPEEAQALLAAGQGHHAALGERLHVELEEVLED
jgi:hypothetical protein